MVYKIDPTISFKYYLKEIIAPVKNGRGGLDTNSTSKFFFNHFNNFRNDHNLHSFKIRYTKIWEDDFAVESLQTRNWQYYIERKLNFSDESSNPIYELTSVADIKLLDKKCKKVAICKEHYLNIFLNIVTNFYRFLEEIPDQEKVKIETDLLNKNYFIENRDKREDVMLTFVEFFYKFGRFPSVDHTDLILVPHGKKPFVESKDVISPRSIYANCNSKDWRGLVSVQFLAALNVHLDGNRKFSQNVMNEFLQNNLWRRH